MIISLVASEYVRTSSIIHSPKTWLVLFNKKNPKKTNYYDVLQGVLVSIIADVAVRAVEPCV